MEANNEVINLLRDKIQIARENLKGFSESMMVNPSYHFSHADDRFQCATDYDVYLHIVEALKTSSLSEVKEKILSKILSESSSKSTSSCQNMIDECKKKSFIKAYNLIKDL